MFSNECLHFLSINTHELELPCRSGGTVYFHFLWDLRTVFPSGRTSLHLLQQHTGLPFSPHPCQHLLSVVFLMIAILRGWPIVVLICVSWMMSAVEQLFMCLLAISMPFWEKCLFRSSVHILIRLLLFYIGLYELWPSSPPALNLSPPSGSFPVLILTLFLIGKNWSQIGNV